MMAKHTCVHLLIVCILPAPLPSSSVMSIAAVSPTPAGLLALRPEPIDFCLLFSLLWERPSIPVFTISGTGNSCAGQLQERTPFPHAAQFRLTRDRFRALPITRACCRALNLS